MKTVLMMVLVASPCYGDLIHHYPFAKDEADAVAGGAANGSLIGGAEVSGGVLNLDGIDDFVQIGTHVIPISGSYTVALFAQQSAPQAGSYVELISQGFSQLGPPWGFYIGHNNSDPTGIRATDASHPSTGVLFPVDGRTHHYALVVDARTNESRLYLDGSLAWTLRFAISGHAEGTHTRLGCQFEPYAEFFAGTLDDVRIYDSALSASEVEALSQQQGACGSDLSGDGLIDGADLGLLLADWGTKSALADLNGDGMVDGADLGLLLADWGSCP